MKGEIRDPMTVWLLVIGTCGLYGYYLYYTMGYELKGYLGRDDLEPATDIVWTLLCFVYAFYLPFKYGGLIQDAQRKAGIADAQNQGLRFLMWHFLVGLGYMKMQQELNRVWAAEGAA